MCVCDPHMVVRPRIWIIAIDGCIYMIVFGIPPMGNCNFANCQVQRQIFTHTHILPLGSTNTTIIHHVYSKGLGGRTATIEQAPANAEFLCRNLNYYLQIIMLMFYSDSACTSKKKHHMDLFQFQSLGSSFFICKLWACIFF